MNVAPELASAFPEGQSPEAYVQQMSGMSLTDPSIAPPHTPATADAPAPAKPQASPEASKAAPAERPAHIPEKFWDAATGTVNTEALLKSYSELEKGRGKPEPEPRPTAKIEKPADPAAPVAEPQADAEKAEGGTEPAADEAKAPDPAVLTTAIEAAKEAYAATGEVTPELIEGLVTAGLPQDAVEMYFHGLRAYEASIISSAHQAAGGQEKFDALTQWAAKNLSDADLAYYNGMVSTPDNTVRAVEWLVAKHGASNPSEGTFVQGQPSAVTGDVYASQQEMLKDMQSPQYTSDPAFRQRVAEKVQRSQANGMGQTLQFFG